MEDGPTETAERGDITLCIEISSSRIDGRRRDVRRAIECRKTPVGVIQLGEVSTATESRRRLICKQAGRQGGRSQGIAEQKAATVIIIYTTSQGDSGSELQGTSIDGRGAGVVIHAETREHQGAGGILDEIARAIDGAAVAAALDRQVLGGVVDAQDAGTGNAADGGVGCEGDGSRRVILQRGDGVRSAGVGEVQGAVVDDGAHAVRRAIDIDRALLKAGRARKVDIVQIQDTHGDLGQ